MYAWSLPEYIWWVNCKIKKSGWWESNPRIQLGRLVFYHWTTPAQCPVPESNQRHEDFQSSALPTELTGQLICLFYLIFLLLSRHCSSQIVRHSLILLQFTASFAQNTHTGLTISRTCTGNIAIYVASSDNVYSQNLPLINMIPATHVRMTVDQFSSLERA